MTALRQPSQEWCARGETAWNRLTDQPLCIMFGLTRSWIGGTRGAPTREVHSPNVVECAGGSPVIEGIVCSIHLLSPVQVKVFRCVCGFRVRAMLSQGRSAAFRMDPETWQKLCAYSNQVHAPRDCPRFLEAIDSCGRTGRRSQRPRRPCS